MSISSITIQFASSSFGTKHTVSALVASMEIMRRCGKLVIYGIISNLNLKCVVLAATLLKRRITFKMLERRGVVEALDVSEANVRKRFSRRRFIFLCVCQVVC